MANKTNWWLIIGVVIVVSVISSIITITLMQTGGVRLSPITYGNASIFKSNWWIQGIFESTVNAGGIALVTKDGKQFELQSAPAYSIPGTLKSGFVIYDRNAGQYREVIDSDGNVGIGKTNPQAKLDVAGDIKANGQICDRNGCIGTSNSSGSIDLAHYEKPIITKSGISLIGASEPWNTSYGNFIDKYSIQLKMGSVTGNVTTSMLSPNNLNIEQENRMVDLSSGHLVFSNYNSMSQNYLSIDVSGIVMKSLDGKSWKCAPNNGGVWTCVAS